MKPTYMASPSSVNTSSPAYRVPDAPLTDEESQFMQQQWESLTPAQQAAIAHYETEQALKNPVIQLAMLSMGAITGMWGYEYTAGKKRTWGKTLKPYEAAMAVGGILSAYAGYKLADMGGKYFYMSMFWRSKYPKAGK